MNHKSKCDYLRQCYGSTTIHILKYSNYRTVTKFKEYCKEGLLIREKVDKYVYRYSLTDAGIEWIKRYSR